MTQSNKEITKASYEATASEFALNVAKLAPINSIEEFLSLLPAKAKILDLGCGSGRDAKIFTEFGAEVVGIDFSANLIEIAKGHAPRAKFALMDIENMDLAENTYDGVWAVCSLTHIAKKELPNVLKKIHLLLKEDGYFYLALKKGSGEVLEQDKRYEGEHKKFWSFFTEDEIRRFLQEAHFNVVDFAEVEKNSPYQTHSAFRIFCQKS